MSRSLPLLFVLFFTSAAFAKTVTYELVARKTSLNITGQKTVDFALTLNGQLPAPTLEFTEGDIAEITVRNELEKEDVSIHWHGILLPPLQDGVPYVNTPPILPGQSFTFRFPLRQHGTYWYHSHTGLQEQKGLYGAFIVHPRIKTIPADHDVALVISDWSDENADQILKNLKKDGDYYLFKKNSVRSYMGALRAGQLKSHLKNEWTRMGGMDLSDVGYDAFLINGKKEFLFGDAKAGERVRLRLINASASSYFYVSLGASPMTVISADGIDIEPHRADRLLMGMAETYDILFTLPASQKYELRATAQDQTGSTKAWIGSGEAVSPPPLPPLEMYGEMKHDSHGEDHDSHHHHTETHEEKATPLLTVDQFRSPLPTVFPAERRRHEVKLVLDGDMERYVWHLNGKAIHEDRLLEIQEGDVVRFQFVNETMMHHPMHLHGHFFRVLNHHGDHSPLKHTVDVPPHQTREIEFFANEPGQWMLHCHNLYHLKTGMARVVRYSSWSPSPEMAELDAKDPHLHDHFYFRGDAKIATNQAELKFRLSQTWNEWMVRAESRNDLEFNHGEADLFYRRWTSKFFYFTGGASFVKDWEEPDTRATGGIGGVLPMLIDAQLLVDHTGDLRLDLEKSFQWTSLFHSEAEIKLRESQALEWQVSLMARPQWGASFGILVTEKTSGLGFHWRF